MKYVFDTKTAARSARYVFPTHINDLIIDRADACASEVFVVIVEPGKAVHLHKHDDVEQIFYILDGQGILSIGSKKAEYPVGPGQVIKIPPKTLHTIRAKGKKAVRYLCVDCFCKNRTSNEPTWKSHVKAMCRENGYDYKDVSKRAC